MSDVASILPPNATPVLKSVEQATARIGDVPTPNGALWDPRSCPAAYLPWLAWALSVTPWDPSWPEAKKRAAIAAMPQVHIHRGTRAAVEAAVGALGGAVAIREWWQQDPPGQPYTFDVAVTLTGDDGESATAQFIADVTSAVELAKPLRAHFTVTQGLQASGGIGVQGAGRAAVYCRLQMGEAA